MYVEEVYEGGTKCDLPDMEKPRKAIIRVGFFFILKKNDGFQRRLFDGPKNSLVYLKVNLFHLLD